MYEMTADQYKRHYRMIEDELNAKVNHWAFAFMRKQASTKEKAIDCGKRPKQECLSIQQQVDRAALFGLYKEGQPDRPPSRLCRICLKYYSGMVCPNCIQHIL